MKTRVFLIVAALWAVSGLAALEVPPLSAPVTDLAGLLSSDQTERLNTLLLDFEKETSNQFALLIIPSLEGEDLESYSLKVAETWALGQAGEDNGLLLLVAPSERRLRIEVFSSPISAPRAPGQRDGFPICSDRLDGDR